MGILVNILIGLVAAVITAAVIFCVSVFNDRYSRNIYSAIKNEDMISLNDLAQITDLSKEFLKRRLLLVTGYFKFKNFRLIKAGNYLIKKNSRKGFFINDYSLFYRKTLYFLNCTLSIIYEIQTIEIITPKGGSTLSFKDIKAVNYGAEQFDEQTFIISLHTAKAVIPLICKDYSSYLINYPKLTEILEYDENNN